jgi:AraC family transcriptional regulator, transcriptional activator of the genes for pyochelin and ferripyochelin receptors
MRAQTVSQEIRIHNEELPWQFSEEGQIQILPIDLGQGSSKLFQLTEGLSCIETHIAPRRDLTIVSRITDQQPRLVLTLGLQGTSRFGTSQGEEAIFKAGYSTITTFTGSQGCRCYKKASPVSQLRFTLSKSWLEEQFGEGNVDHLFKQTSMLLLSHRPLSKLSFIAAQGIMTNTLSHKTQPMFKQGQALSILACELNHLFAAENQTSRLTERDRKIATLARDILSAEFNSPPTISQLCKRLGTNPCKLKQLFHACYGTTPYHMLLDIRMSKAYQLLNAQHSSVSLVAEAVGYNHISNFSAAFLKYYGFTPKQAGQRKL